MLRNYERQRGGFDRWGRGVQIDPRSVPTKDWLKYHEFSGGYDTREPREDTPRNASPYFLDMEVNSRDSLIRAPGVTVLETFTTRTPSQLVLHAALDYTAEILLFDAPFLGVKGTGATAWTDYTLADPGDRGFAYTTYGDILVFSSGSGNVYARTPGGVPSVIAGAPAAYTYANFAARLFAGNAIISGTREPMGIQWNAASSLHTDWTGTGSGFEILVGNRLAVDKIISLIPIGFDTLAIVCRRSLWVGTRTGLPNRPADFQLRIEDTGAFTERVCVATPYGVAYLGDDGVSLFDGNNRNVISMQIESDLFPLDLANIYDYALHYHQTKDRLVLLTPIDTWIYDFKRQRWYRRSLKAIDAESFTSLEAPSATDYDLYMLGVDSLGRTVLGNEDDNGLFHFDVAMLPRWEFPLTQGEYSSQLVTVSKALVSYYGTGTIELYMPGMNAEYTAAGSVDLPLRPGKVPLPYPVDFTHTGLGLGLQLRITSGSPVISRIELEYIPRGPQLAPAIATATVLYPVLMPGGYWVFVPFNQTGLGAPGAFTDAGPYMTLAIGDGTEVVRKELEGYVTIKPD